MTATAVVVALLAMPSTAQASDGEIFEEPTDADPARQDATRDADQTRDTDQTVVVPEDLPFPENLGHYGHQGASAASWPDCWHIVGCGSNQRADADTAYMNCQSSWIDAIALSYNVAGTSYDAIHIDYSWQARIAIGAAVTSVLVTNTLYDRMHDCLDDHSFDPDVRSWNAIWQQLHCHVYYQIGAGATWDLEGHRQSDWSGYLNPLNRCGR